MDETRQGAAATAEAFLNAWCEETEGADGPTEVIQSARGHGSYPRLTVTALRAVLDENREMQRELAALRKLVNGATIEYAASHFRTRSGSQCLHGAESLDEACQLAKGSDWTAVRRLVGSWQPADDGGE